MQLALCGGGGGNVYAVCGGISDIFIDFTCALFGHSSTYILDHKHMMCCPVPYTVLQLAAPLAT